MFERFAEDSRVALFYARLAISEHGGTQIEPEHLVLGVLRGAPEAIRRFTAAGVDAESLTARLNLSIASENKQPDSYEARFSRGAVAALERASIEASDLGNAEIRSEHLILGVMVKTTGEAAEALREAGVTISAIRQFLAGN